MRPNNDALDIAAVEQLLADGAAKRARVALTANEWHMLRYKKLLELVDYYGVSAHRFRATWENAMREGVSYEDAFDVALNVYFVRMGWRDQLMRWLKARVKS